MTPDDRYVTNTECIYSNMFKCLANAQMSHMHAHTIDVYTYCSIHTYLKH